MTIRLWPGESMHLILTNLLFLFCTGQGGKVTKGLQLQIPPPPMSPHESPQGNGPPHHVPLGVNMIVWSLDTCFILAAIVGEDFLSCTMKCHKDCMISWVNFIAMHGCVKDFSDLVFSQY
jgi:hypothetical protein